MGARAHLGPGQFFGEVTRDHQAAGLVIGAHRGTVSAAEVRPHDHEAAHVVFAPYAYVSSAAGARDGAPMVVVNPPGTRHRDRFEAVPAPFLAITISTATWRALAEAGPIVPEPRAALDPGTRRLADAVLAVTAHGGGPLVLDLAWQLLGELVPEAEVDPTPIARARELLLDAPERGSSIAALAAAVAIHPVYLARGFRRAYRTTPTAFSRSLRLAAAVRDLAAGASPTTAALEHGFADQAHLTRWMRRLLGVTPAQVRGEVRPVQDEQRRSTATSRT